mmetsp:Transcript_123473/g.192821  ORF Transcript_123473/g.192821 Transcript_123473/m.192821 type:complete len:153 (-) Transcript_123473:12-470(-)
MADTRYFLNGQCMESLAALDRRDESIDDRERLQESEAVDHSLAAEWAIPIVGPAVLTVEGVKATKDVLRGKQRVALQFRRSSRSHHILPGLAQFSTLKRDCQRTDHDCQHLDTEPERVEGSDLLVFDAATCTATYEPCWFRSLESSKFVAKL